MERIIAIALSLAFGFWVGTQQTPRPQILSITHLRTCEGVTTQELKEEKWLD